MNPMQHCRDEGMMAHLNGLSYWSCPYPSDSEDAENWREGWMFAADFKTMAQFLRQI